MSEFSMIFSEYIHQKGYSIRALAKRLDVPVATLTKLCNGTRGPEHQVENVRRVCDLLMLTPAQSELLYDALEKEIVGVERYTSRIGIKNLLESIKRSTVTKNYGQTNIQLMERMFADKKNDVYTILQKFIENAAAGHTLDVFCVSQDPVVLETLRRAVNMASMRIRHIIPMCAANKRNDTANAHNIDAARYIQPLVLESGAGNAVYQPVHYYERHSILTNNTLHMPNIFISDQGVLRCSADYTRCIYVNDSVEQRFYSRLFGQQFAACRPLVSICSDIRQQISRYEKTMDSSSSDSTTVTLSWQPCLMWAVQPQEVGQFMNTGIAFRSDYLDLYVHYLRKMQRRKVKLYFTQEGLYDLLVNGRLREIPERFVSVPLPLSYRRELLQRLLDASAAGSVFPRVIREEKFHLGQDAQLLSYGSDTIVFNVLSHGKNHSLFFIEEFSTNWSALDFLENLENTDWLFTVEQSCDMIREMMDLYLCGDCAG